jgi:isopropylmalate/homocitrate/citramalate synthase
LVSEVGPRDGLQSIDPIMSLAAKCAWIDAEVAAGVREGGAEQAQARRGQRHEDVCVPQGHGQR